MENINLFVIIYITAISLQISGAVILLWNSASTKRDDVIKSFMKSKFVSRDTNTSSIEYDENAYKELFKVAMLNKISFGYIAAGYIINIWGDYSSVCKMYIAFAIVICSAMMIFLTNRGVLLWLSCSKEVKRKIINDDLERLDLHPDMESISISEIENID